MKAIKTAPDRKALEAGFLILSLMPHRATAKDPIKQVAKRVAGLNMRILRGTSYERTVVSDEQSDVWRRFWHAYTSLEAPGVHVNDVGLIIPEYPLAEPQDVNRCDLARMSESFWGSVGKNHVGAKSGAAA